MKRFLTILLILALLIPVGASAVEFKYKKIKDLYYMHESHMTFNYDSKRKEVPIKKAGESFHSVLDEDTYYATILLFTAHDIEHAVKGWKFQYDNKNCTHSCYIGYTEEPPANNMFFGFCNGNNKYTIATYYFDTGDLFLYYEPVMTEEELVAMMKELCTEVSSPKETTLTSQYDLLQGFINWLNVGY